MDQDEKQVERQQKDAQTKYQQEYQAWLQRKKAFEAKQAELANKSKAERDRAMAEYQRELQAWEQEQAKRQKELEDLNRRQAELQRQQEQARQQQARQQEQARQREQDNQQDVIRPEPVTSSAASSNSYPTSNGNIQYQDITLLDYPIDTTRRTEEFTRPYTGGRDLTLDFVVAPSYGLAKNESDRARNAREIARKLGKSDSKYRPSDREVLKMAYVLARERSSGADLGYGRMSPVNVQRERAAILYALINSLEGFKTHYGSGSNVPKTIEEVLAYGPEYVYYSESDKFRNINEMERVVSPTNKNIDPINLKTFVRAFFDGYFNNEIDKSTHWSHMRKNKWSFFHIPPDAKWDDGSLVRDDCTRSYGCTSSTPTYIFLPNGFFSRAFKL